MTEKKRHIADSYMKIEGSGSMGGNTLSMSSAQGELQVQTALAIISVAFLKEYDAHNMTITLIKDNEGVQKTCQHPKIHWVGPHRKAYIDLQLEHVRVSK
jgi:hypothetical protein